MGDAERDSEDLKIEINVIRANQLPDLKSTLPGRNRRFYITVDDRSGKGTKKTTAIRSKGNSVNWDEKLDDIRVEKSARITVSLNASHRMGPDELIGTVKIDPKPAIDASFTLTTNIRGPPPIVVLTIRVSSTRNALEDIREDAAKDTDNAANAMKDMHLLDDWKDSMENMIWLMEQVEGFTDIHPIARGAWKVISAIPKAFAKQIEIDTSVEDLVKAVQNALALTKEKGLQESIKPYSNQALLLKAMLIHITRCCEIVIAYAKDGSFQSGMRLLKNITGGARDEINGLCTGLSKLRDDFLDSSIVNIQITINDMHNTVATMQRSMKILLDEESYKALDSKINELPYDSGWSSTANKSRCLEGTRTDFIDYITKWIHDTSGPRGLILFGQLGTGKSTIAHEIAYRFYFEGSYFSFSRAKKSIQRDHHVLTTIIGDIADRHPAFKHAVGELIEDNRPLRTSDDINQLFTTLVLGPLEKVGSDAISGITVIVIDALDECSNPKKLAKFLSEFITRMPSNFRVLITSRPESTIIPSFPSAKNKEYGVLHMSDDILAAHVRDDILLYFKANLTPHVFQTHGLALSEKSGGLFQWAAVACGYISEPPAGYTENDCLRGLLGSDDDDKQYTQELQSTKLYGLYGEVLSGYFTSKITRPRFCTVMGQLLCAFEPVSFETLTGLRSFVPDGERDEGSVHAVLRFMGSLLSNSVSDDKSLPIIPLHISFRDFLTDTVNKHAFSINLPVAHRELAYACFDIMQQNLSFNICQLESSHLRNSEVEDLQSRITKSISPALFYACRFWDDHLRSLEFEEKLLERLERFFTTKFLFWLEVLSVTNTVPLGVQAMNLTINWLQQYTESNSADRIKALADLVVDGRRFLRSSGIAIATSAPHIYVSALSFAPAFSRIYEIYSSIYSPSLVFKQGQLTRWSALEMLIVASRMTKCVDFSPDGERIASGLSDGTLCIWNGTTGMLERTLSTGHPEKIINSIAFSPDGQQIVSGSEDGTIRSWNIEKGTTMGPPWVGHRNGVTSVTFSPNGQYVLSGSKDVSIRIWNLSTGSMIYEPVQGHTDNVNSVSFSSDGKKIISGSNDCTVRIWRFHEEDGVVQVYPLLALQTSDPVLSVAISPNGLQVAAGCAGQDAYIWDNPLQTSESVQLGHTGPVSSVKFSRDGQYLVTGTHDSTLVLWDVGTKKIKAKPLLDHTDPITSVAISVDGQRIASASYTDQINIWAADVIAHTSKGHISTDSTADRTFFCSVVFSPVREKHFIVTGTSDGVLCTRDSATGDIIDGPFNMHASLIGALAFSQNGHQAVSGSYDGTLCFWNVADNGTMELGSSICAHSSWILAAAFSPDGLHIVSSSYDGEVRVWNAATCVQERSPLTNCSEPVRSVFFLPDSHRIIGLADNGIWAWDISDQTSKGHLLISGDKINGHFVASLPDSEQIISCSYTGDVRFWNSSTGQPEGTPFTLQGIGKFIPSYALSPDGVHLAAVSRDDFTITVWNMITRKRENACPLVGHSDLALPEALSFSPNGQQLASGSRDSTIRIWNLSAAAHPTTEDNFDLNWSILDAEGWACGSERELLLWVPQVHRSTYRRPSISLIITPTTSQQTDIDYSHFAQGKDWTRPCEEISNIIK